MSTIIKYEVRDSETYDLVTPIEVRCGCGNEIELWDSWANACNNCGKEYNGSGQELSTREFWGEETGEVF